jgi:NTP pyrophosphatase (non-canonical NTP hydrolase)
LGYYTFGNSSLSIRERCRRFLEEALELVQACGISQDEAQAILDYVYKRSKGEVSQEIGGVMVSLFALADIVKYDAMECASIELDRIESPEVQVKCREKQRAKVEAGVS